MVLTHFDDAPQNEEIRMSEEQVLQVSEACERCHQSEYARWSSGGHATTYADIFLDEEHNKMEAPYPDCLRCHGMFFDDNIEALMEPLDTTGPWRFKDPEMAEKPTVPCLACHQMHTENGTLAEDGDLRNPAFALYSRADKMYLRADKLVKPEILHNGKPIDVSDDYAQRLCVHCHSPNFQHEAGTEDDRTPTGVHEGLSCNACHEPHSNSAANSCVKCHPATSNCNLDVHTMDTTFANPNSPNNIHSVGCSDCHEENNSAP